MTSVNVVNLKNEKVGVVDFSSVLSGVELNKNLLHSVVRWQLAGRRQGTHMTKTKGLVSGGGKKPFKQKGTGNARQGSTRSPLMPGGGTTFGPLPRDYSYSMPKKMKKSALKMAITHLLNSKKLYIVDEFQLSGKTKQLVESLNSLGVSKAVITDVNENVMLKRAAKNLEKFVYVPVVGLNVYDLLKYDALVCTKSSVAKIIERFEVK